MRWTAALLAAASTLTAGGCPQPQEGGDAASPAASPAADAEASPAADASPEPVAGTFDVVCGCAVEAIGHCGEYAVIEGGHVELTGHDLGAMPFCGEEGLRAEVEGERTGDAIAVTKLVVAGE